MEVAMGTVSIDELLTREGSAARRRRRRRLALGAATATVLVAAGFGAQRELGAGAHEAIGDGAPIVHVAPLVAGRVVRVHVSDDKPVAAGDVLIEIDPEDFAAALVYASATVAEARGRLEQTRWQLIVAKAARSLAAAPLRAAGARGGRAGGEVMVAKAARSLAGAELVAARDRGARAADARAVELEVTTAEIKQAAAEAQVELVRAQIDTAAPRVLRAD